MIFIIFSLKFSNLVSASLKLSPLTAKYTFIFGSVPEGLTTKDEPSSNIYFNTLDFGKLITASLLFE